MFRIQKDREGVFPVNLPVARGDGSGRIEKVQLKLKFRLLDKATASRLREVVDGSDSEATERVTADLMDRVTDWQDVGDQDGNPLDFSRDNLDILCNAYPNATAMITSAIIAASLGQETKNL